MRLIDADALKEQVCLDGDCTQCKTGVNEKVCKWNIVQLNDVIERLESAPTIDAVPHWIPCKERMPEEYNQYLVCTEEGDYLAYWFDDSDWARKLLEREGIIAWMPLPEPYVGERKDNEID